MWLNQWNINDHINAHKKCKNLSKLINMPICPFYFIFLSATRINQEYNINTAYIVTEINNMTCE